MRSPERLAAHGFAATALALLIALAGCGGGGQSAESVVRAWNTAVNRGDNERAAELFAPGAEVVQAGQALRLQTRAEAVLWNASLPCAGTTVDLSVEDDTATATFVLSDRKTSACDGPGERASAVFRVRDGKIVLWHQLSSPDDGSDGVA